MPAFWTYWRDRYERDHRLRLDHFLLSNTVALQLIETRVDNDVRGEKTPVTTRRPGSGLHCHVLDFPKMDLRFFECLERFRPAMARRQSTVN